MTSTVSLYVDVVQDSVLVLWYVVYNSCDEDNRRHDGATAGKSNGTAWQNLGQLVDDEPWTPGVGHCVARV